MDNLAVLFAGEISLIAHVGDRDMIIAEGPLTERAGIVTRAAVELEKAASRHAIVLRRGVRPWRIEGQVLPQPVVPAERVCRGSLAARREGKGQGNSPQPWSLDAEVLQTLHRSRPLHDQKPQTI
jgi:hypothetical protein